MIAVRQPTEEEAVQVVMRSLSREYRQECIAYWEKGYGKQFSESVRREVEKRWAAARKKRGGE